MAFATVEDVQQAGRLPDDFIESHREAIEWKINDIEAYIRRIRPSLPDSDYNAKMCVVYGVLAWLQYEGELKNVSQSQIRQIKEGDITITYADTSEAATEQPDAFFDYFTLYKRFLRKIIGVKAFTSGTTWKLRDGTVKQIGYSWSEFFTGED